MGGEHKSKDIGEGAAPEQDRQMIAVAQLVLADKRTSLAVLRTAVAVGLVPVSIATVLVTTSRHYNWLENLHLLGPLYAVLTCLTIVSLYLIGRAVLKLRNQDKLLDNIRHDHPMLARFIR